MGRQTIEKVRWTCDHCGATKETTPGDASIPLGFIEVKGTVYATETQATPFEGLYCSYMCASEAMKARGQGMGAQKPEAGPAAAKPAGEEAKAAEEKKEPVGPISRVRFRRR